MPQIRVTTLGAGDAFGSGGRHHTAILLQGETTTLLVDPGPCVMSMLKRAKVPLQTIDIILVTHLHGDHIAGFPFMLLEYQFISKRDKPLQIVGPEGTEQRLEGFAGLMYKEVEASRRNFAIEYRSVKPAEQVRLGDVRVTVFPMVHTPLEICLGYTVQIEGKTIALSGDTIWCESVSAMSRGADLLLLDCTYYDLDIPVHLNYLEFVRRESELSAKRVVLTHAGENLLQNKEKVKHRIADDGETFVI